MKNKIVVLLCLLIILFTIVSVASARYNPCTRGEHQLAEVSRIDHGEYTQHYTVNGCANTALVHQHHRQAGSETIYYECLYCPYTTSIDISWVSRDNKCTLVDTGSMHPEIE